MIPTCIKQGAKRVPLTTKGGNKDYYKGLCFGYAMKLLS